MEGKNIQVDINLKLLDNLFDLEVKIVQQGKVKTQANRGEGEHVDVIFDDCKGHQQYHPQHQQEALIDPITPLNLLSEGVTFHFGDVSNLKGIV